MCQHHHKIATSHSRSAQLIQLSRWLIYLIPAAYLGSPASIAKASTSTPTPTSPNISPESILEQHSSNRIGTLEHTLADATLFEPTLIDDPCIPRVYETIETTVATACLHLNRITGIQSIQSNLEQIVSVNYAHLRMLPGSENELTAENDPLTASISSSQIGDIFHLEAIPPNPVSAQLSPKSASVDSANRLTFAEHFAHLEESSVLTADVALSENNEQHPTEAIPSTSSEPSIPHNTDDLDIHQRAEGLGNPVLDVQGAYILQGNESSARLRLSGNYAFHPNLLLGTTIDLTSGDAFVDSGDADSGIDLNELYLAFSPDGSPNLRFVAGMIDLTAYFDRNSFAKDVVTHFFHPVFQTNPALAAAGLESSPGLLAYWSISDHLELKAATFSSSRNLNDFSLDAVAGEIAVRLDNLIIRSTYITAIDSGDRSGFDELFQIPRHDRNEFGVLEGDREAAFGLNAEYFINDLNLGLFARYGWYHNLDLDESGSTYSLGLNLLDFFIDDDRLGLAYGQALSNADRRDGARPDVLELFYDARLTPNLRAGLMIQARDGFSETIAGFRIRADFDAGQLFR